MAMEGKITKKQQAAAPAENRKKTMADYIKSMSGEIAKALPKAITAERFTRITLSALSSSPKLQQCTPSSFLAAMMTAAQLGVEPNTPLGQAYLVPYYNKGTLECQFQIGYKGLIDLAYRSGEVQCVQAHEVHENDEFSYSFGLEPELHHVPAIRDRGAVIAYYAVWKGKDGGYGFEVMSREDAERHGRKFSKSFSSGPWKSNFDEMAKKTVLKKALKYAPMKTELVYAAVADETVKHGLSENMWEVETIPVVEETEEAETDEVVSELDPDQVTIVES